MGDDASGAVEGPQETDGREGARDGRDDAPPAASGGEDPQPFEAETFSWTWVGLGFLVMTAAHAVVAFALLPALGRPPDVVEILLGLIPYLLGGAVIGLFSRDETLLEPFYAALIPAFFFPFIVELRDVMATRPPNVAQTMARMEWLVVFAPVLANVLVALFACWLAEKLSGARRGET